MTSNMVSMPATKSEILKFDGRKSFSLWKNRMWSSLALQGLWKAIEEKFSSNSEELEIELQKKILSAIFMSLMDSIL